MSAASTALSNVRAKLVPWLLAALVAIAIAPRAHAAAADPAAGLSDADKLCLGCHGAEGLTKTLQNGDTLALHVSAVAFAKSVHKPIGCQGCHAQVKLPDHPADVKTAESASAYKLAMTQVCASCHERVSKTYEISMHAVRLREGSTAAPTCADCHRPHEVTPASVQDGPKNACLTCHAGAGETHTKWLPNAVRHLESVACAGCHAPDALRKVDLRLVDSRTRERFVDAAGLFERSARAADKDANGLDARELRALLADFAKGGADVELKGHIELRSGVDAHELPFKPAAVRDCTTCHRQGMAQFQRVTVSALDGNGRPLRYDAQASVLSSVLTVDALSGFYAIGGTRIRLFDALLGLALVGGISVPVLHIAVRTVFARRRKNGETR